MEEMGGGMQRKPLLNAPKCSLHWKEKVVRASLAYELSLREGSFMDFMTSVPQRGHVLNVYEYMKMTQKGALYWFIR